MRRSILITSTLIMGMTFALQGQMQKIGPDLQAEMASKAPDELIPIVINLSPKPDLEALQLETEGMGKRERRSYVISQLKTLATNTQTDVLSFLDLQRTYGKAQSIKSIYLANVVAVQLQNQLISTVANLVGVNYVFLDHVSFDLADTTWNVEKIRADDVWQDFGYKGQGVLVGVMDTGTDYNHTDLHSNVWNNLGEDVDGDGHTLEWDGSNWILDPGDLNGIDDDANGYIDDLVGWDWNDGINQDNDPMDDFGHGTHVSGTIAGDGTNGTQTGVSPEAGLMILKIWEGGSGPSSNYWTAVQYALDNGADVINLSGGKRYYQVTDAEKATYRQVFEAAVIAGITICVAAGNEGNYSGGFDPPNNIRTPGNVPLVITVAATDVNDNRPNWSSKGPVEWWNICKPDDDWGNAICYNDYPYPPGLLKPDVSAPGVNITSTQWGGGYIGGMIWSGTSMATPATSGTIALILEASTNILPKMAKDILEETALDLGISGKDSLYGSGRIDAYEAINLIISVPSAPQNLTLTNEGGYPRLRWNVNSEPDIIGYNLYKALNTVDSGIDTFVYFVTDTTYLDEWFQIGGRPPFDFVKYWVKAVDTFQNESPPSNSRSTKGQSWIQWKQVANIDMPYIYRLHNNYPNPFNPVTIIKYDLPEPSIVTLSIYNLLGEKVRTLIDKKIQFGFINLEWNSTDNSGMQVPSGIYIYKINASSIETNKRFTESMKMILIR